MHEVESMMSARIVPWHMPLNTNTIVTPDVLTAKDALIQAGLDWAVELQPIYVRSDIGLEEIDGSKAVVRDVDTSVLGIVGSRYTPIQNREAFEFFDTVVGSGEAKYDTAGSLRGGRIVFMTVKIPKEILIGGEDASDLYLVLLDYKDGTGALKVFVTVVRIVCMNTCQLALDRVKASWSLRHTDSIKGKVQQARDALDLSFAYGNAFEEEMNRLAAQDFTKSQFEDIIRDVFPNPKPTPFSETQAAMIGTLESSPTIPDGLRYTKFGALNAVTEYYDWVQPVRSSKKKSEAEQRIERSWFKTLAPKQRFATALVSA